MQEVNNECSESIVSTFLLDDMEFGICAENVIEAIFHEGPILKLPTESNIYEGVINLRENIIPIINMRKRFGIESKYDDKVKCIAVVIYKNNYIGLMFDNISQVVRVKDSAISFFNEKISDECFANTGVLMLESGDNVLQILDLDILFKDCGIHLIENSSVRNSRKFLERRQDITFCLDGQEYAVGMTDIKEIVKITAIKNKVEHCEFVKGVLTLRDELVPIVDLRTYLGAGNTKVSKDSKIVILNQIPQFGIIVDSIKEVIHYEVDKLLPIHNILDNKIKDAFSNIIAISEDRNIVKLNINNLFSPEDKKQIEQGVNLNKESANKEDSYSNISVGTINDRILNKEYIVFKLNEVFALEIGDFQEIIRYSDSLTEIPGSESYIAGVLNLRSEAILIFDLRKYYSLGENKNLKDSRILVLNKFGKKIGIIVDEVLEILKTDRVEVTKTPKIIVANRFTSFKNLVKDVLCVKKSPNNSSFVILFDVCSFLASINFEDLSDYLQPVEGSEYTVNDKSVNNELYSSSKLDLIADDEGKTSDKMDAEVAASQDEDDFFPV